MKAYIVNLTGHNVDSLHQLYPNAEKVVLSEGNVGIFNVHRVLYDFRLKMLGSSEEDIIVLTGSIVLNILAALVLYDKHKKVNILIWHAKKEEYVPRTIREEDFHEDDHKLLGTK